MSERVDTRSGKLKNVDIELQGPISQDDLSKTIKKELAKEFPMSMDVASSRITVTIDSVSMQADGRK